jgi:putative membrane protein
MLFYLPRLFVYHAENYEKREFLEVAKVMERKLIKYIGTPAMWATILSGFALAYFGNFWEFGWLHLKILFVFSLFVYHIYLETLRKRLERDTCRKSGKFFRVLNEYPTLIMIAVVSLVIFKPF